MGAPILSFIGASVRNNLAERSMSEAKLKIQEMGCRSLFIGLYLWLEKQLACGDYKSQEAKLSGGVMISLRQMSERAERRLRRIAEVSLILAAGACVVFWLVRIYYAISFVNPYMMATTGCEEESLFSIWKFTQHQAVYADPHRIPFAASYYNWAYYELYGSITNAWLHLLHLDVIWIPTIGRLVSLVLALLAGAVFYLALRHFVKTGFFANRQAAWAWILIATVGPIVGFWSITVRPDIGALAFEASGLFMILWYLRKPRIYLIVVAGLLFYTAWAFKQSSVTMLVGSVLTLLVLKRWRAFLTLSSIWWTLVIVTLILGGPAYRESVLFSQGHLPLLASLGLKNALRAEGKNPFFLPGFLAILYVCLRRFRVLISKPVELTLTLVVLFSFCFAVVTSCKAGASDNYYITASWAVMLGFALMWEEMDWQCMQVVLVVCSWLMAGGIALSPTGHTYYYNLRGSDSTYRIVAEKLSHLSGPAFVTDRYADLPWMQRLTPHFVLGFAYYYDRAAGVPFEDGGWEGLAKQGYFATLVIDRRYSPSPSLLKHYKLVDEYTNVWVDFKFYCRIDPERH
jgi:hypothetical protein